MSDPIASHPRDPSPAAQQQYESHEPERMTVKKYATTRVSTLKPPMEKVPNPFTLLAMLNLQQWLFFLVRLSSSATPIDPINPLFRLDFLHGHGMLSISLLFL
jgi:hypothetical protein